MNNSNNTVGISINNSLPTVSKFEFNDAEPVLDSNKLRCFTGLENNAHM